MTTSSYAPQIVTKVTPWLWNVQSSSRKRIYQVSLGAQGWLICECVAYVIDRNRNGGAGHKGHCKHCDWVIQFERGQEAQAIDRDALRKSFDRLARIHDDLRDDDDDDA